MDEGIIMSDSNRAVMRGTIHSGPFELTYSIEGEGTPALVIGSAVYYPLDYTGCGEPSRRSACVQSHMLTPRERPRPALFHRQAEDQTTQHSQRPAVRDDGAAGDRLNDRGCVPG